MDLTKVRKRAKTGLFRKSERPNAKRHDYTPQDCRPLLLAQAGYLRPIRLAEVDHGLPLLGHSPRSVSVFTGANLCTSSSSEKITWERKNLWRSAGRGAGWKASGWLEKRPPPPRDSSRCKPESPLFHVHCPASSVLQPKCNISAALSPPIFTKITQTRKVNKKVVVWWWWY